MSWPDYCTTAGSYSHELSCHPGYHLFAVGPYTRENGCKTPPDNGVFFFFEVQISAEYKLQPKTCLSGATMKEVAVQFGIYVNVLSCLF